MQSHDPNFLTREIHLLGVYCLFFLTVALLNVLWKFIVPLVSSNCGSSCGGRWVAANGRWVAASGRWEVDWSICMAEEIWRVDGRGGVGGEYQGEGSQCQGNTEA